jgi:hypothetical protein
MAVGLNAALHQAMVAARDEVGARLAAESAAGSFESLVRPVATAIDAVVTHFEAELRDVTVLQSMFPLLLAAVDEAKHAASPDDLGATAELDSEALVDAQDTVNDLQNDLMKAERRAQHGLPVKGASVDQIKKDIASAQLTTQQSYRAWGTLHGWRCRRRAPSSTPSS